MTEREGDTFLAAAGRGGPAAWEGKEGGDEICGGNTTAANTYTKQ